MKVSEIIQTMISTYEGENSVRLNDREKEILSKAFKMGLYYGNKLNR